jgi:hypothetical protein
MNQPGVLIDPDGLGAKCPGGFWIGAPMVLGEVSTPLFGGVIFGATYSCTSAAVSVAIVSVCALGHPSVKGFHAGCGVGGGWATDTFDSDDFKGWSYGGFATAGAGTIFVEGHDALKPDTYGAVVGPGTPSVSFGPLACKTWVLQAGRAP